MNGHANDCNIWKKKLMKRGSIEAKFKLIGIGLCLVENIREKQWKWLVQAIKE